MQRRKRVNGACILLAALISVPALSSTARGQCSANPPNYGTSGTPEAAQVQQLFDQKNWAEVVRLAERLSARSADVNFTYGLALAHMQRWTDARAALLAGRRECPRQKRFALELAGVSFELKHYPETAAWLRNALRLDPQDDYANNFAGTVYLLLGNVNAALKYWNRVEKPYAAAINFDPQLHVQRLILDRAFAFSPAAVVRERDFDTTRARLDALGIFHTYNIILSARGDEKFDANFHAMESNGFGNSRIQALISTFSGLAYETVYPSYFNVGGSATNVESLVRWDSQKRRAWLSISAPVHDLPQWHRTLQLDARDENWAIRRSFTGAAPVLGSLELERQSATGFVSGIPSGRLQWSAGAELSHRSYHDVVQGTALTPALVVPGYELKAFGSIQDKVIDIPERRFTFTVNATSELARMWPAQSQAAGAPRLFGKLRGAALAQWFPQAEGDRYEMQQRVRAGRIFQSAPFDELFLLGMERDTDLWLRGHIGTRDRRKGSSPLASNYFLSNSDFYRRIYSNGLFSIKAGPLLDIARAGASTPGLATEQWLLDVGVDAKLTVLGTSIVLTYGRDLRSGSNAFYGTAAQH